MDSDAHGPPASLLKPSLYALAGACLLGGIETVKGYVAGRSAPNAFGWPQAALTNLPWWLLWGAMAPLIFALARAFPFGEGRNGRAVTVHFVASVALSGLHLVLSALDVWAAVSHSFTTLAAQVRSFVVGYGVPDLVTYWAILAAYATYDSHRRLRQAERRQHGLAIRTAQLEADRARLSESMTEARLDALRTELNPHFFFNALHTVSALAQRGRGEEAVQVISRLSDFLRRTLDGGLDHQVTLAEELELLDLYLDVERVRFGDRLTVVVDAEPGTADALVPTLVLQPLVENAIRHGVAAVRGPVELRICAERHGDELRVFVRDRGPGFNGSSRSAGDGLGLRNTRSRLATLYGPRGSLELGEVPGGGAEVRLRMPLEYEDEVRVED
jgi:signal transduction histidine kinase